METHIKYNHTTYVLTTNRKIARMVTESIYFFIVPRDHDADSQSKAGKQRAKKQGSPITSNSKHTLPRGQVSTYLPTGNKSFQGLGGSIFASWKR